MSEIGGEIVAKIGRPTTGKARQRQIVVRVSEAEYQRLQDASERTGKSVSTIVRDALHYYLMKIRSME